MNANVRMEEVTSLGDFILTSYNRDFDVIKSKFIKMDSAFRDGFIAKLDFVKVLESTLMLSEDRKGVTRSMYAEAEALQAELNFLGLYFADASLDPAIVTAVKHDLFVHNIEGALLKLENLKQYVVTHDRELTANGMTPDFAVGLSVYIESLRLKNQQQNDLMNDRKQLTNINQGHYEELLKMIRKIVRNGKIVFKGKITQDEYTMTKIIKRMRAGTPKKKSDMNK